MISESVLAAVQRAGRISREGLDEVVQDYLESYSRIGAPSPDQLTLEDAPAVALIGDFRESDGSWQLFKQRIAGQVRTEADHLNPFLPRWYSKTEDRLIPWVYDTGTISEGARAKLSGLLREASPSLKGGAKEALKQTFPVPRSSLKYLLEVIRAMKSHLPLFLWSIGDEQQTHEWAWGPSLCMLAGLGLIPMRTLVQPMADESQMWQHWASCDLDGLADDVLQAHQQSGYPCGLLRLDYRMALFALREEDIKLHGTDSRLVPKWFVALTALHIFKHARLWTDPETGEHSVFAAYGGKMGVFHVRATNQAFSSSSNTTMTADVLKVLGIPYSNAPSREWYHDATIRVIQRLKPSDLASPRPFQEVPDILVAPAVKAVTYSIPRPGAEWVNPGVVVTNIARVDKATGSVNKASQVEGESVVSLKWNLGGSTASELERWRSNIPDHVVPARASSILRKYIRHIEDFGCREGLDALLDAIITCDLLREDVPGSPVGRVLSFEFPPVMVLPTSATLGESTNQGKTAVCRAIGGCLCPGITDVNMGRSTGAPAQRAIASPIQRDGTAVLDEFTVPDSLEHFLNAAGIQTLATGGKVAPGRVMENDSAFGLRHPLFMSAKIYPTIPDIQNRMVGIFLHQLSKETRASVSELVDLMSGKVAMLMRLSHLLWLDRNQIRPILRGSQGRTPLPLAEGPWRFNGHLAVAYHIGGSANVDAYLKAMNDFGNDLVKQAGESGLAVSLGKENSFDPHFYFENCDEMTLEHLYSLAEASPDGWIAPLEFLRILVEDGERRRFQSVLSQFRMREKSALMRFSEALSASEWTRDDWTIQWVPKSEKKFKDSRSRPRAGVVLKNPAREADQERLEEARNGGGDGPQ